ncbi:MAG TPA: CRISPR-associated endonuclease Cas2, partial [Aggregatilineales bacterium]|nr:CRISPR-associated endonuclease Cas2 [Aggregatilineales bacterium]
MNFWVVSYDIANDQRRRKVSKLLEGYGRRAQFSVFECELSADKLRQLEERLCKLIDVTEDDVRFYPINKADLKRVILVGKGELHRER